MSFFNGIESAVNKILSSLNKIFREPLECPGDFIILRVNEFCNEISCS
jgi:hypothetical protein